MFDLLIRNGQIIDGTGKPGFTGDIGVIGQQIAAIGQLDSPAKRVIDAENLIVTPGFVDIHTHYDGQATWDSLLTPSSLHGVTSLAFGNCGVGFAPARPDRHEWLINLLEGVEDIPGTALTEGLTWDWETFPDYLDALGRRKFAVDVGAQIPHAPLRSYVMGDRGADPDARPTAAEAERMGQLTQDALEAGALGFTTSRSIAHRTLDGRSIGTFRAEDAELLTIAAAIKRTGKGVIQLISDAYLLADEVFATNELQLIEQIARVSGRPVSITVQQVNHLPDRWRWMYARIQELRDAGLDVRAQIATRPIGVVLGLRLTTNPFSFTPGWQDLLPLPLAARVERMRDPQLRARLLAELELPVDNANALAILFANGFGRMFRMDESVDYEPLPEHSIAAEAKQAGTTPAEYVYDALLRNEGHQLLYMPLLNYTAGNLAAVHEMMSSDFALFGLSDGGAHCGFVCDASFPTSTLAIWSRGSREGLSIPLERLVHGYTQRNAAHVGWRDRGVLAPGYLADINVIDLDELALEPPYPVNDLPAGGMRLMQKARGYRWIIKRGEVTFCDGAPTGNLPGQLVRGSMAAA